MKETNVGASLLPAMLSGKVDATLGAFWNVEGVELRQRRQRPWIAPGRPARRARLRRAGAGRERGQARRPARRPAPVHLGRRHAAPRAARSDPAAAARPARGQPGPEPTHDPRERARHDPGPVPGEARPALRLPRPGRSGATTAAGWSTTSCSKTCPTWTRRSRTSCCRAKGSSQERSALQRPEQVHVHEERARADHVRRSSLRRAAPERARPAAPAERAHEARPARRSR